MRIAERGDRQKLKLACRALRILDGDTEEKSISTFATLCLPLHIQ